MAERAEVTAAEIARLAGVGRAAVGNWRKRHADFPQPVGGSTGSPTFRLSEVELWLAANNRKLADEPRQRVQRILLASPGPSAEHLVRLAEQVVHPSGTASGDDVNDIVKDIGQVATFDLLLHAYLDLPALTGETPATVSRLMAALAEVEDQRVHDPACGAGGLLAAALENGAASATGVEADERNATMTNMRLALRWPGRSQVRVGGLLDDPYPDEQADVVLCHPPFAVRNWGFDELAYDERWSFGVPAKPESELAWVQHCLARVRPGGTVLILLPPAVAARSSGRRVRAELLRRGALRAVVSIPPGMASPPHLSLQLWLLTRPDGRSTSEGVRLIDASGTSPDALLATLTSALRDGNDEMSAVVAVVDMLDDEVDVTPARHLADRAPSVTADDVLGQRDTLIAELRSLPDSLPPLQKAQAAGPLPMTTIAELVRTGALTLYTQPGTAVEAGDVLVTVQSPDLRADVATGPGQLTGNRVLLRPDPNHLDSWFLAGFVARPSNHRLISSLGSTQRLDVRRAAVPRIPLDRQRGYSRTFVELQTFRDRLINAVENGQTVANLVAEGLAAGTLTGQTS